MVKFKPQRLFPYYGEYKNKFPITDETIFVYKDTIYTNTEKEDMPYDILHHELRHLAQQHEVGAKEWIKNYLEDDGFRLGVELDAYVFQLQAVKATGDKTELAHIKMECARNISSSLYGNLITYAGALKHFNKKL